MKFSDAFENLGIKLVCLLLAIVVWLYANKGPRILTPGERGSITFLNVPVQLTGLAEEGRNPKPEKISLVVECIAAEIATDTFRAVIKLTQMDITKGQVTLTAGNIQLPEGMSLVKVEPHEIKF